MKIPLIFGASAAACVGAVSLILHGLGYHADIAHYQKSQGVSSIVCFAIIVTGIGLAIKTQRARTPLDQPFGMAKAFGTGLLTAIFTGIFGAIVNFAYFRFIDPALVEILFEAHVQTAKNAGLTGEKLSRFEADARIMMQPTAQAIMGFLMTFFMGIFISAFAGFIMRRKTVAIDAATP